MVWMTVVWMTVVGAMAGVHQQPYEIAREGTPLQVRATWSDGTAPMPIVVMSHGMGGSRDNYGPLVKHWAEAGFLVLAPTHPDALALRDPKERRALLADREAMTQDRSMLAAFDDRPIEVRLVLDHLDAVVALGVDPARIDREHIAVAGHSFGAHTAMLCGGLATPSAQRLAEPRADAVLLLSPQGTGLGITAASYAGITIPTLMVTGSQDKSVRTGQGPQWRLEAWKGLTGDSSADSNVLLWLDGATHDLGGISGRTPPNAALLDAVLETTTEFLRAHLLDDAGASTRLRNGITKGGPSACLLPAIGTPPACATKIPIP